MNQITNTNVRVGPGVYLALKENAEKTGLSIGTCANLIILLQLYNTDKTFSNFSKETQKALIADLLGAISDIFRIASLQSVQDSKIADLYRDLLGQSKT